MGAEQRKRTKNTSCVIPRRTVLRGAVVASAMALGGIPGMLRAGQAPANPKGTRLHLVERANFINTAVKMILAQAREFGKLIGVEVMVERISQNDVMPRATAAIAAQTGPDIIRVMDNYPHLLANGLADVSDVAEEVGKAQGGYPDIFEVNAYVGTRWLGISHGALVNTMNYREDWLREVGYTKFPETYEELYEAGKKLKANGHSIGQCFSHSGNDPNSWCYSFVWAYGAYEVEKDGKTVALDKKGTLEALKLNNAMWKDCFDEGGLSWDDTSNNRAFLAESVSITANAASIYFTAKKSSPSWPKT